VVAILGQLSMLSSQQINSYLLFKLKVFFLFFLAPTSFINGFQQNSNVMMMIDLRPSPLVLDAPNLSQI
jgi:hypothetical protein